MKKEAELSRARARARVRSRADLLSEGKTRITIYLDDIVIERFRAQSGKSGKGYQTLLNEALRGHLGIDEPPLTATALRRILREELSHTRHLERLQ